MTTAAEDRGSLAVHQPVVRKIAERAADLVAGTVPTPRRRTGLGAGDARPRARIDGDEGEVSVTLEVAFRYPSPVREVCDAVRRVVTAEIQRITGYQVRAVQVRVCVLLPEPRHQVR